MNVSKIIIIGLFFTNINLIAQSSKYIENERLIRVKNNICESFQYRYDIKTGDTVLCKHKTYNKSGYLLTDVFFLSSKRDTTIFDTYKYKGDTLIKKCNNMKFDNYRVINEFKSYSYDKKGNKIEIKTINQNEKKGFQKIIYNSKNQKIALYTKWSNQNKFSIAEKNNYSKKNNLILSSKKYSENGNLDHKLKYEYDNLGNLIKQYLLKNGEKDNFHFFSYDKNNFLIESEFRYGISGIKPTILKTKYEYDTDNNIIKEYSTVDNVLIDTNIITYKKFE